MSRIRSVKLTSRSVVFAIAVHGLILLLLGVSIDWNSDSIPMAANKQAPVQAQAIAAADLDKELKKIKDKDSEKIKKQQDQEKKLKELKEEQEREKKKLAELEKKAKEAEAQRVVDEKQRQKDDAKRLALKKEQKEQAEKAAAEKKRKKDEATRLAEKKKKAEAARKLAEEEKRKKEEQRRIADLEREKELERELQNRLEDERNERLATSTFTNQYVAAIQQKVSSNWIRPPGAQQGLTALVAVSVTPGGDVLSARVVRGSGDPVFDRSVVNAVLKASPLPFPQDPKLYEFLREFKLEFRPDQLVS